MTTLAARPEWALFADWLADDMTLTPTEYRIAQLFEQHFGEWLPGAFVVRGVYGERYPHELLPSAMASLRTHVWRMRHKLESTPWRIENHYGHGKYRLVRPQ